MSNMKRSISALLAIVMIFTTMTVAFTVISSAAPTAPRIANEKLSPNIVLTVPEFLEAYGTDYYQRGSNIKSGPQVQATITSAEGDVKNVALACSDAGVQLSARVQQGQDGYVWTIQGGTLVTAPANDGSSSVKWTITYSVNGVDYSTEAWSPIKPVYNNPGFSVYVRHKNGLSAHDTKNHHVEWITPVYGAAATETADHFSQCFINTSTGKQTAATGGHASSYYWDWDQGSGDDETHTAGVTARGTLYVDISQKPDLSDVGLMTMARPHGNYDNDGNHMQYYLGAWITKQYINGSENNAFALTSTDRTELTGDQTIGDTFSGQLPIAGSTAQINAQIEWEGQITRLWGFASQQSYHRTITNYTINIVTYDKTVLKTALSKATKANYQERHFRTAAPTDGGNYSAFRSWSQYRSALQTAWTVYGREDVSQEQITNAANALTAALPTYNDNNGNWISGMMYGPADYSRVDTIKNTIGDTLEPDFYEAYSDGTYGKYYQYSLASQLVDALDDIEYDRPLDARYQGTVDQMRANLSAAINALIETETNQTTKLVSLEFIGNQTDVRNVPGNLTTSLTGKFVKPTTDPSKDYYKFLGWFYDEAATQPVSWPLTVRPNDGHFKADLNTKVDNAGVAYTVYAGWQMTGKTLTFDSQGGSSIAPVIGNNGDPYGGPTETPTKAGYRFLGWYADATLQTPVDWNTFTFGSLSVVYAKWEKDYFTVTFDANGGKFGDGTGIKSVTDLYGNTVPEPETPTRANYGFVGWYYDSGLTQAVNFSSFTIPSSNTRIYAKWSDSVRNVTINPQNGTTPVVQTVAMGTRINEPATPSRAGYTFKGWYDNAEATGDAIEFPFILGGENVTLYGGWNPLPFNVYFEPGDGATMAPGFKASDYMQLPCGSVLVEPETPIKEGYMFTGWTLGGEPYTFTTVPAQNITLVGSWIVEPNTAKFRLRTDAGSSISQGDVITATVSLEANHIVSAHSFVVYYDSRYLVPAINGVAVTASITGANACSKTPGQKYFTVVQNAGGNVTDCGLATGRVMAGIAPTTQYFPSSWIENTTTLKEEYQHYQFVFFSVTDTSTGTRMKPETEQDIASFQFLVRDDAPLADGMTSYAQLLLPSDFTRTPERTLGKVAACPEESTAYNNKKNWDNTTNVVLNGDHRFAVVQMQTCRINFITNGGSTVDAIPNAKRGRTIELPTPTKQYYDFAGWTLTNSTTDTNYVNASAYVVPNQDSITLYAKWTGKQVNYYVRHHKQNTTATGFLDAYEQETLQGAVGTTVYGMPKDYPGFSCTNAGESGIVSGDTTRPLVIDLYYLRKNTKITLNANGGTFSGGQQAVELSGLFDTGVSNPYNDPTRTGYTFDGWQYKSADYTISKYPPEDIVVNAKWAAKTITVRFFLNGSTTPSYTFVGNYGDPLAAPTVQVNEGEMFSGWRNGSGASFNYTTFPANDEDFFGTVGIDGHMLTLYVNGVQYGQPIPVPTGTQVTEAYIGYTAPPGFSFTGWRISNSVDAARVTFPMTLSADTTFYGFTTRVAYTIQTYIYVDGALEEGPSLDHLYYGNAFDLPEVDDYTDAGYGFRGWYVDPELTTLYEKPDTMPAENIVLYGEYYELVGTVKFDLNGGTGTVPANLTGSIGSSVNLPGGNGFSKQFYKFGGWSTSKTGTTPITSVMLTGEEPVTVYAIWTINYATLSFNLNGADTGTRPASMQVEVGTAVTAAELPAAEDYGMTKEGYIFVGWSDKSNATAALESYTPAATGTKVLFAVWIADKVDLIAQEGSTTIIDKDRGFIYGLKLEVTVSELNDTYLDVVGNGHLNFKSNGSVGTGTVVEVINDYSNTVDATYVIVIFGDINGDGRVNTTDVNEIRKINAHLDDYATDSAQRFAADANHDNMCNTSDVTVIRQANAKLVDIKQSK